MYLKIKRGILYMYQLLKPYNLTLYFSYFFPDRHSHERKAHTMKGTIHKAKIIVCCVAFLGLFITVNWFSGVQTEETSHFRREFLPKLCVSTSNRPGNIPKIVHQVLLEGEQLDGVKEKRLKLMWQERYPDFKYILWNSSGIETLLKSGYPTMEHVYREQRDNPQVLRYILRYVVTHSMGGVFVDSGTAFSLNMADLCRIKGGNSVLFEYSDTPFLLQNQFVMASKGHDFLAHVMRGIWESGLFHPSKVANNDSTNMSSFLTERYLSYHHKDSVCLLPTVFLDFQHRRFEKHAFIVNDLTYTYITSVSKSNVSIVQVVGLVLMFIILVKMESFINVNKLRDTVMTFQRLAHTDGKSDKMTVTDV